MDNEISENLLKRAKKSVRFKQLLFISGLLASLMLIICACGKNKDASQEENPLTDIRQEEAANSQNGNQNEPETPSPQTPESPRRNASRNIDEAECARFDAFLDEQFIMLASSDTLTMRYMMREPENFGVFIPEPTLGEYGLDYFKAQAEKYQNALKQMLAFDYDALDYERQIAYDIYKHVLESEKRFENYYLYGTSLNTSSGMQSQLPVLLAEYKLYDERIVEEYLTLLTLIDGYFKAIIEFETEKSKAGLFMSDEIAESVIKSILDFATTGEDCFLIETFNERVDALNIPDAKKQEYKNQNHDYVINHVIQAYYSLAEGVSSLMGTGVNDGGLCNFDGGAEYYQLLLNAYVGSNKTVDELLNTVSRRINALYRELSRIIQSDEKVLLYFEQLEFPFSEPAEMIEHFKTESVNRYPAGIDASYIINYVHPSLQESMSPAFYLTPPIDDFINNIIYINGKNNTPEELFSVLAHEGYPGHLYQTVYFRNKNPHPIRHVLNFVGYTEGWATYVQLNSYKFMNFGDNQSVMESLLSINDELSLAIQSRIDLGVNHEGWDKTRVGEFLTGFGLGDPEIVNNIFEYVIQDPGHTLKYYIGYLEFVELRTYAESALNDDFSEISFHRAILDIGPAPFSFVEEAVYEYIESASGGMQNAA